MPPTLSFHALTAVLRASHVGRIVIVADADLEDNEIRKLNQNLQATRALETEAEIGELTWSLQPAILVSPQTGLSCW